MFSLAAAKTFETNLSQISSVIFEKKAQKIIKNKNNLEILFYFHCIYLKTDIDTSSV